MSELRDIFNTLRRIESLLRLKFYRDLYNRHSSSIFYGGLPEDREIGELLKQDESIAFSLQKPLGEVEGEQSPEDTG
jgi:hypothetical protein